MKTGIRAYCLIVVATWSLNSETLLLQNGLNGYSGCADTYLVQAVDKAQGTKTELVVEGYHCSACIDQRALIRFDLSAVPVSADIGEAKLSLYVYDQPRPGTHLINVHRINQAWDENNATWYKATASGQWIKKGSDFTATPVASYTYTPAIKVWHTVDLTAQIKEFRKNPQSDFGIILYMEPAMFTVRYVSSNSPDQQFRPKLAIVYSDVKITNRATPPANTQLTYIPGRNAITVRAGRPGLRSVSLMSMQGRMLARSDFGDGNASIDISKVPAGIFVLSADRTPGVSHAIVVWK
jgi:hypothetical protein